MKLKFSTVLLVVAVAMTLLGGSQSVQAQYMPVVFDQVYSDGGNIVKITQSMNGDLVMVLRDKNKMRLACLDRVGHIKTSRLLTGFTEVSELTALPGGHVLVAGQSGVQRNRMRNSISLCGRVVIFDKEGTILRDIYVGSQGSSILKAQLLPDEALLLGGYELKADGNKKGLLAKVDAQNKELYKHTPASGDVCAAFVVMGNSGEYVYAAFSAENNDGVASVVRLDGRGKAYYTVPLPAEDMVINAMAADISDGSIVVVGSSELEGGVAYKLRPEGDIVFTKKIVPISAGATLNHLFISRTGNILVGGTGERGYYSMMRSDGTSLLSGVVSGAVSGVDMNPVTGESVVTSYDAGRGAFLRISPAGRAESEAKLDGNFDKVRVDNTGDVLLVSTSEGRVSLISARGVRMFDRYVSEDKAEAYDAALFFPSGEVVFVGMENRLVKMGHGLYISDVKITKPVNGYATALFTVTLTGYGTTTEGDPVPVTVNYGTVENTAVTTNNYVPVGGKLSFTPGGSEANRYLIKQDIEVPIKANDMVEGSKEFALILSDVQQSYLIKPVGKGLIEDQQAVVKLIATTDGQEGSTDIGYQIGLFKTDGTPLRNVTGTNIIVDGGYGKGSSDALDFDMGRTPHSVFTPGSHTASFTVKTLSDTRYELPKSVIVNFDKVHALSTANVGFEGDMLSCRGSVIDQPAMVAISSLGDHTRINHNVVSGFFTVTLRRASDGALLTNTTGGDIVIGCKAAEGSTAQEGKDFVFTNHHNLRIDGNGNFSAVNLSGIVLYSPDKDAKSLKVLIDNVQAPAGAQPISVSTENQSAESNILN